MKYASGFRSVGFALFSNSPAYTSRAIFFSFLSLYIILAWLTSAGQNWWLIDFVDGQNVFYGDDAYRFFLSRSAWINPELYTYNFVLPGALFLDGVITFLVSGDLFLARCIHAMVGSGALALIWGVGVRLGISRYALLPGVVVLGLIPRYALMSLSFYGEVWLGFFLVLSLWLYLGRHFWLLALVAGWLPLLRPEGIFFLGPVWMAMLLKRRWKEAIVLVLPGVLYFVYLNISLPSLADYMLWRTELRRILDKLVLNRSKWQIIFTYSWLFFVPGLLGATLVAFRGGAAFVLGGLLWLVWLQFSVLIEVATYESRYTYVLLPLMALSWSCFFDYVCSHRAKWISLNIARVTPCVVALAIVLLHFAQMDRIKIALHKYGVSGLFYRVVQWEWDEIYEVYSPEFHVAWRTQIDRIISMLEEDQGIDKLVIYDSVLYYGLDPYEIPDYVTVGFPSSGYMVFHLLLDGQVFIQHPGGRMFSYLNYGVPDFRRHEKRALCVDIMPLKNYPYSWRELRYELYLFSYAESHKPKTDIESRPLIYPETIQKAYMEWYYDR